MPQVDIVNLDKKKVGTIELRDDVFGVKVNPGLVHQVVTAQLANRRQGTAKTKTKSEVRGGGRKPFKQKGTGNARQGSTRSPLMPGGGQSFGPVPRDYRQYTTKAMVRGALRSVLTDRLKAQRILVVDQFGITEAKTKALNEIVTKRLQLDKLLLIDESNRKLELSGRNLPRVKVVRSAGLNVYDVLDSEWVVISKQAIEAVQARLAQE